MNYCDASNHVDIAYDGGRRDDCPLCAALDEIKSLEKAIEELSK